MTVKVNGVAQDGTTIYIHNKVHNRTRTLTCAGVSVFDVSIVTHQLQTPSQTCVSSRRAQLGEGFKNGFKNIH